MKRFVLAAALLAVAAIWVSAPRPAVAQKRVPDLYNLGPIGGKAAEQRAGAPAGAKSALMVRKVAKGGPGAKADLQVGDVIYGAGGEVFGSGAYLELAGAIEKAESGKEQPQAICSLMVKRAGETLTLKVQLTAYGSEVGGIPGEKLRDAVIAGALKYLARAQDSDGGFHINESPEASQVVLTSLAGLAWLAGGQKPKGDKYSRNINKAADFVMKKVGVQKKWKKLGGRNNNRTNWGLGYGGIFLAEAYLAGGKKWGKRSKCRKKLVWIRNRIFKQMEKSGGFGHGPGGPNLANYVELEIMSNFTLAALGCIRACGIKLDAEKLEPGIRYIEACASQGAICYAKDKMYMPDVGRTAGAINAFAALGVKDRELYAKMLTYLKRNVDFSFGGHSTPTMHQVSIAVACKGNKLAETYWKSQRHEFTMVRNYDHTFSSRPTADTRRMGRNLDRELTPVWTTAHWAIVLGTEKYGCPGWMGAIKPPEPEPEKKKK